MLCCLNWIHVCQMVQMLNCWATLTASTNNHHHSNNWKFPGISLKIKMCTCVITFFPSFFSLSSSIVKQVLCVTESPDSRRLKNQAMCVLATLAPLLCHSNNCSVPAYVYRLKPRSSLKPETPTSTFSSLKNQLWNECTANVIWPLSDCSGSHSVS